MVQPMEMKQQIVNLASSRIFVTINWLIHDRNLNFSHSFAIFRLECRLRTSHSHCWPERSHDPPMYVLQSTRRAHTQPTRHKNRNKSPHLRQYLAIKQIKMRLKRFLRSICEMRVPSLTGSISCVSCLWKRTDISVIHINRLRKKRWKSHVNPTR